MALSVVLEEMGPGGYGIYWLLLEHFASVMEKDCTSVPALTHSLINWSKLCYCSTRAFRNFADRATELQLIESRTKAELKQNSSRLPAERLEIGIPKLLKYRDEYSRKSGVTPDKLPARSDTDTEADKKTPKPPRGPRHSCSMTAEQRAWFAPFYELYPRKIAPAAAEKAWAKKITAREQAEIAYRALRAQLPALLAKGVEFIPYPATWINQERWRDEATPLDVVGSSQFIRQKTTREDFY